MDSFTYSDSGGLTRSLQRTAVGVSGLFGSGFIVALSYWTFAHPAVGELGPSLLRAYLLK